MINDGTIHIVDEARMKEVSLEQERQNRIWQKEEEEKAAVKQWHNKVKIYFLAPIVISAFIGLFSRIIPESLGEYLFPYLMLIAFSSWLILPAYFAIIRPVPEIYHPKTIWFKHNRFITYLELFLIWSFTSLEISLLLIMGFSGAL